MEKHSEHGKDKVRWASMERRPGVHLPVVSR